jgi:hypothetical protein
VWWTQGDVTQEAPVQPPPEKDLDYLRVMEPHPFVSWCFERYLHPVTGQASLTNPPYSYPPGFVQSKFFQRMFLSLQIVMTVKLN